MKYMKESKKILDLMEFYSVSQVNEVTMVSTQSRQFLYQSFCAATEPISMWANNS